MYETVELKKKQVYVLVVSVPFNGAISPVLKILFKKERKKKKSQNTSQFDLTTNVAMYHHQTTRLT